MDIVYSWAAGFLDGEGCFSIKRYRKYGKGEYLYYIAMISCGQAAKPTGIQAIQKLQELFGGGISKYYLTRNRSDVVSWMVTSKKAKNCIEKVYPYLIVKKPQAEILLEFIDSIRPSQQRQRRLSEEETTRRKKLAEKISHLNSKGNSRLQRLSEKTPKGEATVRTEGN